MSHFFEQSREFLPILLRGLDLTLVVALGSLALSTVLGLLLVLMRISGSAPIIGVARVTIIVIRGIPAIVMLFYIYFVMPDFSIALTSLQAAIIGLGVAHSAYQAENFRAGIEAIDRGQTEAALSIGMGWGLCMRRVILPQAIRVVLPSYGNSMVMLLKDSSLASTITVTELSLQGKLLAASTFDNTTIFTLVALLYLSMSVPLTLINSWLERRMRRGRG